MEQLTQLCGVSAAVSTTTFGKVRTVRSTFLSGSRPLHLKRVTAACTTLFLIVLLGVAASAPAQTAGARVPFTEINAGNGQGVQTNGTVIGPNYDFGTLASEATGRQAVELAGVGQYVSFTLTRPANAITVHYAIPDAPAGGGIDAQLGLYANGALETELPLTSAYSWLYEGYPYSKTPTLGMPGLHAPHDFYNDVRYMFSSTLPAGAVVKLQIDAGDNSPWYVINTADFEEVADPIPAPSNSMDVTQAPYSADKTGASDATSALQNAIRAGETSGKIVYLPAGTYRISSSLPVNNVTVEGAGEWYTVLTGSHVGFSGQITPASVSNVNISNLAIFGTVTWRDNKDGTVNAFHGGFSNSIISNVWIQNTKVGLWIFGPTTNLTLNNLRIMDLKADGINFHAFHGGVTNSTIKNSFLRNTQDDGIALWSAKAPDTNDKVTQNTIDSTGLANGIAVYGGGSGVQISNNLVQDSVWGGGGIHVGQRFNSVPMSGTLTISNNQMVRCGAFDGGFNEVGAIWFWPKEGDLNSTVNLSGNIIQDSPYSAIQFLGPNTTTNVNISHTTINNVGTVAIAQQGSGSAKISETTATGVKASGILTNDSFNFSDGGGNSGLATLARTYPRPPAPLWVYPDILTFQGATVGQTTNALQVAVINKSDQTATLGRISASSGFTITPDPKYPCGGTLAGNSAPPRNGWCLIDVSFTPRTSGVSTGILTIIPGGGSNSPKIVHLVGSTGGSDVPASRSR